MQHFDHYSLPHHEDGQQRWLDPAIGTLNACLENTQAGITEEQTYADNEGGIYVKSVVKDAKQQLITLKAEERSLMNALKILQRYNHELNRENSTAQTAST